MTVFIEDLKFETIIGILDFERETPQDVILNVEIEYEYTSSFLNYAEVSQQIKEIMIASQFLLIEEALETLGKKLKEKFSLIKLLKIKITKPSILPDCRVSVSNSFQFDS